MDDHFSSFFLSDSMLSSCSTEQTPIFDLSKPISSSLVEGVLPTLTVTPTSTLTNNLTSPIESWNPSFITPFNPTFSTYDQPSFSPIASSMCILNPNRPIDLDSEAAFRSMDAFPRTSKTPIPIDPSTMSSQFPISTLPISIQANPYSNYILGDVASQPLYQTLGQSSSSGLRSQASNSSYNSFNPYLDPNSSCIPFTGTSNLDIHQPNQVEKKHIYKCYICGMQFPTHQAYGGHMSSHSKEKNGRRRKEKELDQFHTSKKSRTLKVAKERNTTKGDFEEEKDTRKEYPMGHEEPTTENEFSIRCNCQGEPSSYYIGHQ